MKILYHHRIGSKDGQFVHIEELVTALRALGHEVLIVGPAATRDLANAGDSRWVGLFKRCMPGFLYELLEFGYNALDYARLVRAAKRFRPDVIYERYNLYFISGILAKRRLRVPLLLEVNAPLYAERSRYGGLAIKRLARWTERFAWRGADKVFAVTGVLARCIEAEGVVPGNIVVTPNGINARRFSGALSREAAKAKLGLAEKVVLGFVGFMREWHRLDKVVELLVGDAASNLHFVVVGEGPAREALIARARAEGVEARITVAGNVEREHVADFVSAFDIALQPHVVPYASPLKLFEYMACGCAIVAPDTENIREILTDQTDACLFDVNDAQAFARAAKRLIDDAGLRTALGVGARATLARRDLTWAHNAATVAGIATELCRPGAAALNGAQS